MFSKHILNLVFYKKRNYFTSADSCAFTPIVIIQRKRLTYYPLFTIISCELLEIYSASFTAVATRSISESVRCGESGIDIVLSPKNFEFGQFVFSQLNNS